MASKEDIMRLIANEEAPIHRNKIAEKLGESSYRSFQIQLDRLTKAGYLSVTSDHEYSLTETGKKNLSEKSEVAEELDEEKLGTTESARFIRLGKLHGVSPPELIHLTQEHVWAGGDYRDLDWVARAMQEMGIAQDKRNRWWHSWRTALNQPIPGQLPSAIVEKIEDGKEGKGKKEDKPPRSYILDANNNPVFVGGRLGDLDYEDAKELALAKAAGRAREVAGAPQTPGSMADELVKLFTAFQQFMGNKAEGKSWVMRQGEDGNVQIEEAEPGRPMIITYPQGNKTQPTKLVTAEGEVLDVAPGQPVIIKQPAAVQQNQPVQYLIDRQTGQYQQVQPGQPIIIQTAPQNPFTPIQFDKDGKPLAPPNLETWFKVEDWKLEQQRKQERHEAQIAVVSGLKDLASKATAAFARMAEKK